MSSAKLIAQRYAKALLDIGLKQKNLAATQQELAAVNTLVREHPELERLVSAPLIAPNKKLAAFDAVLEKAGCTTLLRHFFQVVSQSARLDLIHDIADAFQELVDRHTGILNAAVTSAHALSPLQAQALEGALSQHTGKRIRLTIKEDSSLLGGLKVQVDSTVFDASLHGQLRLLKAELLG